MLGTPDILEDLLLLGVLDGKVVFGSMNRGGLAGTSFEIDDRFTAYDAQSIANAGFNGGRRCWPRTPKTPQPCGPPNPADRPSTGSRPSTECHDRTRSSAHRRVPDES